MRLTVLNVAEVRAPVGLESADAREQLVAQLDAAVSSAQHRSLVLACEGSRVTGRLLSVPRPEGTETAEVQTDRQAKVREVFDKTLRDGAVDVIHLHVQDIPAYLPPPGIPVLSTLHLPASCYAPCVFQLRRPRTYLVCVSRAQRLACPPAMLLLPEIPNGVELGQFSGGGKRHRFVVAVGSLYPEHGFHLALAACLRAEVPLLLAGDLPETEERYFRQQILPRLDATRRYVGPVDAAKRRRLLAAARCVLIPSLTNQTSSLLALEALASGTPVIGFPSGILPEVVEHGQTGFLVTNEEEMAAAIAQADTLDALVCRRAAENRFDVRRTCRQYLQWYKMLAKDKPLEPELVRAATG